MTPFTESQSYSILFDIIVGGAITGIVAFMWRYVEKKKYVVFGAIPFALLTCYFMIEKFETRIDEQGIFFKMFPAQVTEQKIAWSDVSQIYMRNYILYSRTRFKYDVYSINDQYGLYIILKDGTKIILGTKKPDEMKAAIQQLAGGRFAQGYEYY